MPVLISTGQTTIYDQNDGKVVNFNLSVNRPATQIATKVDESTYSFNPDFTSTNLIFTANVYVGGVNVAGTSALSSVTWTVDGATIAQGTPSGSVDNSFVGSTGASISGAAFGTVSSTILTIKGNLLETTTPKLIKFAATYTDPVTTTTTPIEIYGNITSIANGSGAVFLSVTGNDTIKLTNTATGTKNKLVLKADLVRSNSIDDTGITYRWSISPYTAGFYIDSGGITASAFDYKFSLLSTTAVGGTGAFPNGFLNDGVTYLSPGKYYTNATNANSALSTTTTGVFGDYKGLFINDLAIPDYLTIKCEARDANYASNNITYTTYFSVRDSTDPWDVKLETSNGGVLTNGSGNINIYPRVFNGTTYLTDSSNYTFSYEFRDKDGNTAFMIDTSRTTPASAPTITANTTSVITLGSAATLYAGDIIKCTSWDGATVKYFEVASASTGTSVTIKTVAGMYGSNVTTTISANIFHSGTNYGRMYICKAGLYKLASATANTAVTVAADGTALTVTLASATPLLPAVINGLNIGDTIVCYTSAGAVGGYFRLTAVHTSGTTINLKTVGTGSTYITGSSGPQYTGTIAANALNDGWIGIYNRHTYLTLKGGASLTTPQITLSGYDVDSKENITCYAYSSND